MACRTHDSRKLVYYGIKPKGLLWHVHIVRALPMPCFNWIALNMKETILILREIVEIQWSSIICGDVDGASEKQDTSGDASSETRLQSSSSFSRLTHRANDTRSHLHGRTHGLSLTLQSMLDCFAINSQCFAGSRLFEIIWLFWMFQDNSFAANVRWMNVVLDCFALPWSLHGRGIVCRAWRVPRHLLVGLLCGALVRLRWISFSFCIPVCFEFCLVLAFCFLCVCYKTCSSTPHQKTEFSQIHVTAFKLWKRLPICLPKI